MPKHAAVSRVSNSAPKWPHCAPAGAAQGKAKARYRGPRLADLTVDDLRRRELPWQAFLRGGERGAWAAAYNLPEHVAHLCERCEENLVAYLVRRPPRSSPTTGCALCALWRSSRTTVARAVHGRRAAAPRVCAQCAVPLKCWGGAVAAALCLRAAADARRAAAGQLPARRGRGGTAHCVRTRLASHPDSRLCCRADAHAPASPAAHPLLGHGLQKAAVQTPQQPGVQNS